MKSRQSGRILLLLFVFTTLFVAQVFSQYESGRESPPPIRERMFYGGNFTLQFGTYTYIDLSPVIGIWLLPRVALAAGPSYKYLKDPLGSTDAFGGKGFIRLVIIQDINELIPFGYRMSLYAHGEYESNSYRSDYFYNSYDSERFFQDFVLAGFGISQYVGMKSSINISVLWVLNESEIQIYDSPQIRIGFTF